MKKKRLLPGSIIRFVSEWMRERKMKLIINEEEDEERILNQGLSQEGVSSPLLYAIYTKDIGKNKDRSIEILQFANDAVIYNNRQRR